MAKKIELRELNWVCKVGIIAGWIYGGFIAFWFIVGLLIDA